MLVERQELTVTELCVVLQLPQSTVSRQLKLLSDHGWLRRRREGTKGYYSLELDGLGPSVRRLWMLVREQITEAGEVTEDLARLESVLRERRSRSQEFFASQAGEWDQLRRELFGERSSTQSLLALLDSEWTVGDLGCGTGTVSAELAPFVRRIIAVDHSAAMLEAARVGLGGIDNVELRSGELEALPIADAVLDVAIVHLVLHHAAEPQKVFFEAARVLRPGGVLLLVDMVPHEREEYRLQMGHIWLGFSAQSVERQLQAAGFRDLRYLPMRADSQAKGPRLFVATGRLRQANQRRPSLDSPESASRKRQHPICDGVRPDLERTDHALREKR